MSGRRVFYLAAVALLALAAGIFVTDSNSQATTFRPTVSAVTVTDTTLGGHGDIIIPFEISAPDANFGAYPIVMNSPAFVTSTTVPIGQTVGYLNADARLGLLNQGCFSPVNVNFRLYVASTNNDVSNEGLPTGPSSSPVHNFTADDGDINEDSVVDDASRAGNGIPDGAEWYPHFLNIMFNNQPPTERYFGWQTVPGTPTRVIIQIVMFDAGDFLNLSPIPSSDVLSAAQGSPTAVILNDPTAVPAQAIEDFCTPLVTSTTLCGRTDATPDDAQGGQNDCDTGADTEGEPASGSASCQNAIDDDVDGVVNDGCPQFGPEMGTQCNNSTDDDADGFVNDGCPVLAPTAETQCADAVDNDSDGKVNDGCPAVGGPPESGGACTNATDDDGDGRINDGCPIVNGTVVIRGTNPTVAGTYDLRMFTVSQRDVDNDGIENWLDPCPYNADTWDPRIQPSLNGPPPGGNGTDTDMDNLPNTCDPTPSSLNLDYDADSWFNRVDNCPLISNVATTMTTLNQNQLDADISDGSTVPDGGGPVDFIGPECDTNPLTPDGHYHTSFTINRMCIGGTDNDGDGVCDGFLGEDDSTNDTDGDGVLDDVDNCISRANAPLAGGALPQMSPDINGNGVVQIDDITYVAGKFGKSTGTLNYRSSADLANQNGVIQIDDITAVAGAFGKNC